jgi:hypothetical protein
MIIDVSLGTLNEQILHNNLEIIPERISWFMDALPWMRGMLRVENSEENE